MVKLQKIVMLILLILVILVIDQYDGQCQLISWYFAFLTALSVDSILKYYSEYVCVWAVGKYL